MPGSCSTAQSSSTHPYLGDKLWSTQVGTDKKGKKITMQDSIKDNVINQIKTVKVLADHADDYKVKLTSDEKKQLDESVKSFTKNDLENSVMKVTGADKDYIRKFSRKI